MKLSINKENEKPLLAPQTTARRKGSRNMGKRILKSPGKKFKDQRRLNQFKAKRRLSFGFAATDNCLLEEKGKTVALTVTKTLVNVKEWVNRTRPKQKLSPLIVMP